MAIKATTNLTIENARIFFKNFSGAESKYNRLGNRNFCVFIDNKEDADMLFEDGWNIKTMPARDEDEEDRHYVQVAVSYGKVEPNVYMISGGVKTRLSEDTIDMLDQVDIENVDLIIRPYNWEVGGKSGVKGYVKTMYVTLHEDDFGGKYAEEEVPFN